MLQLCCIYLKKNLEVNVLGFTRMSRDCCRQVRHYIIHKGRLTLQELEGDEGWDHYPASLVWRCHEGHLVDVTHEVLEHAVLSLWSCFELNNNPISMYLITKNLLKKLVGSSQLTRHCILTTTIESDLLEVRDHIVYTKEATIVHAANFANKYNIWALSTFQISLQYSNSPWMVGVIHHHISM